MRDLNNIIEHLIGEPVLELNPSFWHLSGITPIRVFLGCRVYKKNRLKPRGIL